MPWNRVHQLNRHISETFYQSTFLDSHPCISHFHGTIWTTYFCLPTSLCWIREKAKKKLKVTFLITLNTFAKCDKYSINTINTIVFLLINRDTSSLITVKCEPHGESFKGMIKLNFLIADQFQFDRRFLSRTLCCKLNLINYHRVIVGSN